VKQGEKMILSTEKLEKRNRKHYPADLDVTNWDNLKEHYQQLLEYEINSSEDLSKFIEIASELEIIISDEMADKYIKMTRFADNEDYQKDFNSFYSSIVAPSEEYSHKINEKFYDSPYKDELSDEEYGHLKKIIANTIEIFREENIPLKTKEMELQNKYGELISRMTVLFDGKEQTLAQLGKYLQEPDRKTREEAWRLRYKRLIEDSDRLNQIFDDLKELRIKQARNAGFDNYRDYKHQEMGRFSYAPQDVIQFHDSVEKVIIPFLKEQNAIRKEKLGVDVLRPWDTTVDLDGKVLKPFSENGEFIEKAIKTLAKVDPDFGITLNKMDNTGLLDLENRKGKAPGGYNYPLRELGSSFIFMNSVGLQRDVSTLLHESGHAMHSLATKDINLAQYRECPSEVAELASMAMELLTMEHWNEYYKDEDDFRKAKKDQLLGTLSFLPWCMTVDALQQWIYTNPNHTVEERFEYFTALKDRFNADVDWTGLETEAKHAWMFQLHIFEVFFYYIEYGMAQLGALSIYMNYRQNKAEAITKYKEMLGKGYSLPIDKLYETAGVKFDYSAQNLAELIGFVKDELSLL
jgi:oligoendopeptidase F